MATQGKVAPLASVEAWLDNRPSWMRAAAQRLVDAAKMPDEAGIDALADHCHAEASGTLRAAHPMIVPGVIQASPTGARLDLQQLSNIRGVNAFGARAELAFTDQLTVVYGANGTGKSGYARLLKQVCGARASETILGNVFTPNTDPVSATVTYTVAGTKDGEVVADGTAHPWKLADGPVRALASIHVFDTATAAQLGKTPSTSTHLPRTMRFVNSLITISDQVAVRLRERAEKLVSALPPLRPEFAGTKAAFFHQGLNGAMALRAVNEGCQFTEAQMAERVGLEVALSQADPATAHATVVANLTRITELGAGMAGWAASFGNGLAESLALARSEALASRQAAQDYARDFFAGLPLPGVGDTTWRKLWTAAAAYAQTAYPGHDHPNTDDGARCVLCQQPLEGEAKKRMADFAAYVGNQLQGQATAVEKAHGDLVATIPETQSPAYWASVATLSGMASEAATLLSQQVDQRLAALRAGDEAPPLVDWGPFEAALAHTLTRLTAERDALAIMVDPAGRQGKQGQLVELQAQEWLSQIRDAVIAEVERKKQLGIFEDAGRLAVTTTLTRFSNQIGEAELAGGFAERFNAELDRLGGKSIPVRLAHKLEGKGVLTFSIGLGGVTGKTKAHEVLSEGEQRVVALAAFLADVTGTERSLPVVFDDPISSLDQRFEEAVAARLVELATTRQVIVFTHRLSMGVLIEHAAAQRVGDGKAPVTVDVVAIDRRGAEAGVPATIKVFAQPPKKGFNELDGKVRSAMKLDDEEQQERLKGVCGNFRILVERTVEDHLCGKIVMRYRREIKTGGMLNRLTVISVDDCQLIEAMMTKYSAFEHAQPYDTPLAHIDAKDLLDDIAKMLAWIAEFDKRAAAA